MAKYLFEDMKAIYANSGNYLHRMVPLKSVALMCKQLTPKELKTEFEDLLLKALEDKISNVRFTTCRVLKEVMPRLDSESQAVFKAKLTKIAVCLFVLLFVLFCLFVCDLIVSFKPLFFLKYF